MRLFVLVAAACLDVCQVPRVGTDSGSSSGKLLFDRLIAGYPRELEQAGKPSVLRDFFSEVNDAAIIPVTLIQQEIGK